MKVFDGALVANCGASLRSTRAFQGGRSRWRGSDVNRDGFDDIVVGASSGLTPHVKVFSGETSAELQSYLAFDQGFLRRRERRGCRRRRRRLGRRRRRGRGRAWPHVRVFSGDDQALLYSFYAFVPEFTGGVSVAAGDTNSDGKADMIVGAGAGADPHVVVFDGGTGQLTQSFDAYDPRFRGGVTVAYTLPTWMASPAILTGARGGCDAPRPLLRRGLRTRLKKSFDAWSSTTKTGINVG